jgi:hypothetical protein
MSQLNKFQLAMRSNPNCKAVDQLVTVMVAKQNNNVHGIELTQSLIIWLKNKVSTEKDLYSNTKPQVMQFSRLSFCRPGEEGPSNTPPPFPNLRK